MRGSSLSLVERPKPLGAFSEELPTTYVAWHCYHILSLPPRTKEIREESSRDKAAHTAGDREEEISDKKAKRLRQDMCFLQTPYPRKKLLISDVQTAFSLNTFCLMPTTGRSRDPDLRGRPRSCKAKDLPDLGVYN